MNLRPLAAALLTASLVFVAPTLRAQALMNPPPPPPSAIEQQLAKIESVPKLLAMGMKYDSAGDWPHYANVMQRLEQLRPEAGNIKYELAAAYAMQDDKSRAYDLLVKLKELGWAFAPQEDERFKKVQGTKAWDYIVEGLRANNASVGSGKTAFEIPNDDLLLDSIAYDPTRKAFLVGSARQAKVLRVGNDGKTSAFIAADAQNGLWSVLDLAVDAKHGVLWVASAGGPILKGGKAEDYGKSGVFKFDLDSGKFLARYLVEGSGAHALSSIAVTPEGDVYAADGAGRTVYKLRDDKLQLALGNAKLSTIRGIAISADGRNLYLADEETGIYGIDLSKGEAWQVKGPKLLTQFGIDGLSWYDGSLVAVQAGTEPKRIVRLKLSDDGRIITQSKVVDSGRKELTRPTRAAVAGDKLYLIANDQRDQYDRYGIARDAKKLEPARIFASDLKVDWDEGRPGR